MRLSVTSLLLGLVHLLFAFSFTPFHSPFIAFIEFIICVFIHHLFIHHLFIHLFIHHLFIYQTTLIFAFMISLFIPHSLYLYLILFIRLAFILSFPGPSRGDAESMWTLVEDAERHELSRISGLSPHSHDVTDVLQVGFSPSPIRRTDGPKKCICDFIHFRPVFKVLNQLKGTLAENKLVTEEIGNCPIIVSHRSAVFRNPWFNRRDVYIHAGSRNSVPEIRLYLRPISCIAAFSVKPGLFNHFRVMGGVQPPQEHYNLSHGGNLSANDRKDVNVYCRVLFLRMGEIQTIKERYNAEVYIQVTLTMPKCTSR